MSMCIILKICPDQRYLTGPSYKHCESRAKTLVVLGTCLERSLPDIPLVSLPETVHLRPYYSITRPSGAVAGAHLDLKSKHPFSYLTHSVQVS